MFPRAEMAGWFGNPDDLKLRNNLQKMNLVIQDAGRTVTFVQASGLDLALNDPATAIKNADNYGYFLPIHRKFKERCVWASI